MLGWVVQSHIGVCTKVISLRLDQIGGHGLAPVAVIEGEGSAEARHWHAEFNAS